MNAPDDLVAELARLGQTVATAESLTAGLVCVRLTSVPGSSAVVRGGLIVYATELKVSLAGVDSSLLAQHGPIHPEVARQLALGAQRRCGAGWGLGLTGIAGPGPQNGIAAGTVHIGIAGPADVSETSSREDTESAVRSYHFEGERKRVQDASAEAALDLLREHLGLSIRSLLA